MGGSKSKPIQTSARTVLARRPSAAPLEQDIRPPISSAKNDDNVIKPNIVPEVKSVSIPEEVIDKAMLSKFKKWPVATEMKMQQAVPAQPATKSASIIRMEEEQLLDSSNEGVPENDIPAKPGRLTESRVMDLYTKFRMDTSDSTLADQFSLPLDVVKSMRSAARAPLFSTKPRKPDDLRIAK